MTTLTTVIFLFSCLLITLTGICGWVTGINYEHKHKYGQRQQRHLAR